MRKIFVSIIFLVVLCVNAYADVVYTTDSGNMGLIKIGGADSITLRGTQYTSAGKNLFLGSYWDGSKSRVILVDRTTDRTSSGDKALIFDPANLTKPLDSESKVLTGVYNTQAIIGSNNGNGIFFGSEGSVREFNTETFLPARSYTYKMTSADKSTPIVKSLLTGTYNVYALFSREDSSDIVFAFDGQLRDDTSDFYKGEINGDASCIAWVHGSIAAANSDGVKFWRSNVFLSAVSSDAPVKALCEDGDNGFYFAEQAVSGDGYVTTLKHYSSQNARTLFTDNAGTSCQLMRDGDNNLLIAITGSNILIYNMNNDSLVAEYNSSSLGGLPVNVAASYVYGDDGESKSGCEVAGTGIIMLLAGALIFTKQH